MPVFGLDRSLLRLREQRTRGRVLAAIEEQFALQPQGSARIGKLFGPIMSGEVKGS